MTDEERSLYLRFVWGRSRLPTFTERYRHEIDTKRVPDVDKALPESSTCSFALHLPKYTSVEKCKEKLRYAIRFCQSIDADKDNIESWD